MVRVQKKGQKGQAKNYITRTQAVRKLQIPLASFRRLCIFKGIYPREPRNLKKASKSATHSTTFYYTKDIQYLLHEPLLAKFREQKSLEKKIARSLGRNEVHDAVRLEKYGTPKIKLDHIIKERYPTFVDAIRDLDDALSLLFLFANLPATSEVPAKVLARCQRLCHEFEHYLIVTNSLRKSFLSIKGIYYQVTIQGQDVMWLLPYKFVQKVTQDVDYRIMATFVQFYCTLLGFVNFRLYTSIGLVYPPKFDAASDERGAELAAFTIEGRSVGDLLENGEPHKDITNGHADSNSTAVQAQLDKMVQDQGMEPEEEHDLVEEPKDQPEAETIDKFQVVAPQGDILPQPDITSNEAASLFADFTFFISREAPRHPIEFLLRAFGCRRVGWDTVLGDGAFTHQETDPRITHQVVDRPATAQPLPSLNGEESTLDHNLQSVKPGYIMPGRTYVQPQWVWDCVNEGRLLPTHDYAPGAELPPHLSPWMKPTQGQYDPRAPLEDQDEDDAEPELVEEAQNQALAEERDDELSGDQDVDEADADAGDMDVASSEDDSEEEQNEADFGALDDVSRVAEASVDDLDPDSQYQHELEAEASGKAPANDPSVIPSKAEKAKKTRQSKLSKEQEELERRKLMMPRKKRKLFEKMQYSNSAKDAEAEKLRQKRRKLEQKQKATQ